MGIPLGNFYPKKDLREKSQNLFLKMAGFMIKLTFEPTEQVFFKHKFIEGIQEIWNKGGFLQKSGKRADFEIRFISRSKKMEILEKEKGSKHYYLIFQRNFSSHRAIVFYHASLLTLQILLKEITSFLIEKDGFLLHASGCQDENGNLNIFLARRGGGKTTVSNLLSQTRRCVKFNDDMVIVRKIKGKWKLFSPPFVEKDSLPTKRETEKFKVFFIKKSRDASIKRLEEKGGVLKLMLKQIWLRTERLDKKTLSNVMSFVAENDFYILNSVLDSKKMQEVVYES